MSLPMRFVPPFIRRHPLLSALPVPAAFYLTMSTSASNKFSTGTTTPALSEPPSFPIRSYTPKNPDGPFPYPASDFLREDSAPDPSFYRSPRYVTHIDDHAIGLLQQYYASALPSSGRILDLCSSWISHFPKELAEKARGTAERRKKKEEASSIPISESRDSSASSEAKPEAASSNANSSSTSDLEVIGLGLSKPELDANPILTSYMTHDLNTDPSLPPFPSSIHTTPNTDANSKSSNTLNAAVCVVSIDYLSSPISVLRSIREQTRPGGTVHLVISNRCFPTKAIRRWLREDEDGRLRMVGDYLWWSGWRDIEVVEVCDGTVKEGESLGDGMSGQMRGGLEELWKVMGLGAGRCDPLWVVRGVNTGAGVMTGQK